MSHGRDREGEGNGRGSYFPRVVVDWTSDGTILRMTDRGRNLTFEVIKQVMNRDPGSYNKSCIVHELFINNPFTYLPTYLLISPPTLLTGYDPKLTTRTTPFVPPVQVPKKGRGVDDRDRLVTGEA